MRRQITGIVHQRSARQLNADLQPVRGWDKLGYGPRSTGRVKQPGDIGVRRNDPARPPCNRTCAPYAQKAVADREARLKAALTKCIVAVRDNNPSRIGGRLQRALHRLWPDHVGRLQSRPSASLSIAISSRLVTTRSAGSSIATPSRAKLFHEEPEAGKLHIRDCEG